MKHRYEELQNNIELTARCLDERYFIFECLAYKIKNDAYSIEEILDEFKHKLVSVSEVLEIPRNIIQDPWVKIATSFIVGVALGSLFESGKGLKFNLDSIKKTLKNSSPLNIAAKDFLYLTISKIIRQSLQRAELD